MMSFLTRVLLPGMVCFNLSISFTADSDVRSGIYLATAFVLIGMIVIAVGLEKILTAIDPHQTEKQNHDVALK